MSLIVKNLTHVYMPDSPFERVAVDDVSMTIEDGDFAAIIGHTGSGKSTLIQHFNGLLKPTGGQILVDNIDITAPGADVRTARAHIGLVFQYPEYQLFEETVYKDIAFGPKNLGLSQNDIDERVREACAMVNIDFEALSDKSPFEISGGQKRRVAIAGVLAMRPNILILDEPTAGLDPRGREEILSLMQSWHRKGRTIVMVSHSMDDVARYAQKVFVMSLGKLVLEGPVRDVFAHQQLLHDIGLGVPQSAVLADALRSCGFEIPSGCITLDEIEQCVLQRLGKGAKT